MRKSVLIIIVILLALILLAGLAFIMTMENKEVPPQGATQGQTGENAGNNVQTNDSQSATGDAVASSPETTESDDLPMMTRPVGGNQSGNTTAPDGTVPTTETSDTETTDPDSTETTGDDSGLDEDELPFIPRK